MSIQDTIYEVKKFADSNEKRKEDLEYEKISGEIQNKATYINNYRNQIKDKVKTAFLNASKMNEDIWNKIQTNDYIDLIQIRDIPTNKLKYTYTFSKWYGLSKRNPSCRGTIELKIDEIETILKDEKILKALKEVIPYDEFYISINELIGKLNSGAIKMFTPETNYNSERITNFNIIIKLNEVEEKLVNNKEAKYNIQNNNLIIGNGGYEYNAYDRYSLYKLIGDTIKENHQDDILIEVKVMLKNITEIEMKYKQEEQKVSEILAKWLMLEMI